MTLIQWVSQFHDVSPAWTWFMTGVLLSMTYVAATAVVAIGRRVLAWLDDRTITDHMTWTLAMRDFWMDRAPIPKFRTTYDIYMDGHFPWILWLLLGPVIIWSIGHFWMWCWLMIAVFGGLFYIRHRIRERKKLKGDRV